MTSECLVLSQVLQDLLDDLKQMIFPHVAVPKNVQFGSWS